MKHVLPENLIPGKEYYIQSMEMDIEQNLVPRKTIPKMVGTFVKLDFYHNSSEINLLFAYFFNYRYITDYESKVGRIVNLNKFWYFYDVEKYKIQEAMENRAVNTILRKITGDKYIYYVLLKN